MSCFKLYKAQVVFSFLVADTDETSAEDYCDVVLHNRVAGLDEGFTVSDLTLMPIESKDQIPDDWRGANVYHSQDSWVDLTPEAVLSETLDEAKYIQDRIDTLQEKLAEAKRDLRAAKKGKKHEG